MKMEKLGKIEKKSQGIDRERESELVLEYQKTRDEDIFMQIYVPRVSTFEYLGNKFHYISDDMQSEVTWVFMKALDGYRGGKRNSRSFNTYYYTSVLNHIRNMIKAQRRNKRTLYNGQDPTSSFVYLDQCIDEDSEGEFHDIVQRDGQSETLEKLHAYDLLHIISQKSDVLFDIAMDMMATGKRPVKRKEYEMTGTIYGHEDIGDCIVRMTGLPKSCYTVSDHDIMGTEARFKINVSCQRAFDEIIGIISEGECLVGVV